MIAMTVLFGIMANNKKITRYEGMVLLMFYAYFVVELFTGAV
jgi:cation:H+ antiporter